MELEKIGNAIQRDPGKNRKSRENETDQSSGYIRYFNGRRGEISLEVHWDGAF